MDLLGLLADKKLIERSKIPTLQHEAGGTSATSATIETVLLHNGVTPSALLQAKSEYYQIPSRDLGESIIPFDVLRYVPEESARYYRFAPIGVVEGALEIGITNPDNLEARDALNFISSKAGLPYKLFLISESDFNKLLEQYKGLSGEVGQALSELETEIVTESKEVKKGEAFASSVLEGDIIAETSASEITEDAPVTKIVATIVRHAVEEQASDIHVEPLPDRTRVRFRIDGELSTNLTLPPKVHVAVVTRIKVLSNMRLDEKRKPQDGRFSARVKGKKVDFRVSTFPTYWGEKMEMRILGIQAADWRLNKLGLSERNLRLLRNAIQKPYGLILISGPTGSGKSTTLYSILSEMDTEKKNVLSLEDPVEYTIPGVSQSQVRPEIGYTFANGLRTTLRQDPNVIMVGEIRDKETAGLAVQAALTGHLVFSTIHTNDSVGIVPRLLDMGVDPYLIPPTLILGVAQRLVRTLCPNAGEKEKVDANLKELLEKQFADLPKEYRSEVPSLDHLYRLKSTPECPSGTRGRTAVFEMFSMSAELERAILSGKPQDELYAVVRKEGMLTIKEDAIIKSAQGQVPFEEVNTLGGEFDLAEEVVDTVAPPSEEEGSGAPAELEV
ncbi:MAG: type II/IV secretion system protein [Patescibacteria group bacterium]|nr:type II/IV secretion system protein [Patescibacteria group bacterium]